MRDGVPYLGAELAQYEEAVRLVPAVMQLRQQDRSAAVELLLHSYQRDGLEAGVSMSMSWSILFVAATAWLGEMFNEVAQLQQTSLDEVLADAISDAADWASSGT